MGVELAGGFPSEKEWQALVVIAKFNAGDLRPSLKEIARKMGLRAVSAVRLHVQRLAELGLIQYERVGRRGYAMSHSIRLTDKGAALLAQYRALAATGLVCGPREMRLTDAQYRRVRDSEVPVNSFRQRVEGDCTVLVFRNWQEREFWGEQIMEVLGGAGGG